MENLAHMFLDGARTNFKDHANFAVSLALNHPREHFHLAFAQSFGTGTRGLQDTRLSLSGPRSALTPVITRIKSRQTLLLKALLPLPDILVTAIQSLPNFPVRMTRC